MKTAVYITFDCAVTAWSLVDRTYHDLSAEQLLRLAGETRRGTRPSTRFRHLIEVSISRLDLCRQLATGAKHFLISHRPNPNLRSRIETDIQHRTCEDPCGQPIAAWTHRPFITTGDGNVYVNDLFTEIHCQWGRFLDAHGTRQP